jgi:hypothetical protein
MKKSTKKSRLEILRGKLRRMGETAAIRDDMPEDVAESFIAELQFCPDCGADAAKNWRPDNRNEQPFIKEMFAEQRASEAEPAATRRQFARNAFVDDKVN